MTASSIRPAPAPAAVRAPSVHPTLRPGLRFTLVRLRTLFNTARTAGARAWAPSGLLFVARCSWAGVLELYWHAREAWFGSERVGCAICKWTGHEFRPMIAAPGVIDGPYRARAVCPSCTARERHRLSHALLEHWREAAGVRFESTLHVAPEASLAPILESVSKEYISVDLEPGAMLQMDIRDLSFEDDTFDFLYCSCVMTHVGPVNGDLDAFREFSRVLRPGGWGIVITRVDPAREVTEEFAERQPPIMAIRAYGQDFVNRVEGCGLKVRSCDAGALLPPEEVARQGASEQQIYLVAKSEFPPYLRLDETSRGEEASRS